MEEVSEFEVPVSVEMINEQSQAEHIVVTDQFWINLANAYVKEECLWNTKCIEFREKVSRLAAYKRLVKGNMTHISPYNIYGKIFQLRKMYWNEVLKKLKEGSAYNESPQWFYILERKFQLLNSLGSSNKKLEEDERVISDALLADAKANMGRFKVELVRWMKQAGWDYSDDNTWIRLQKHMGIHCQQIWNQLVKVSVDKLNLLLSQGDIVVKRKDNGFIESLDWEVIDILLLYHEISVVGEDSWNVRSELIPLIDIYHLVQEFKLEECSVEETPEAWASAHTAYNKKMNRQASVMLLQRRWYELKKLTRLKFYKYWQEINTLQEEKSNCEIGEIRKTYLDINTPTPLHSAIARRFSYVITGNFPTWRDLIKDGRVVTKEQIIAGRKIKKNSSLRSDLKVQINNTDETSTDVANDGDIVIMEPNIETIDVECDSDIDDNLVIDDNIALTGITEANKDDKTRLNQIINKYVENAQTSMSLDVIDFKNKHVESKVIFDSDSDEDNSAIPNVKVIEDNSMVLVPKITNKWEIPQEFGDNSPKVIDGFKFKRYNLECSRKLETTDSKKPGGSHPDDTPRDINENESNKTYQMAQLSEIENNDSKCTEKEISDNNDENNVEVNNILLFKDIKIDDINENKVDVKAKKKVYTRQMLKNNPDFEINLKRLSEEFLNNEHNRKLLKLCHPLSVDCENCIIKNRIGVEEGRTTVTRVVKPIQLPNINDVRKINRTLLVAEVSPFPAAQHIKINDDGDAEREQLEGDRVHPIPPEYSEVLNNSVEPLLPWEVLMKLLERLTARKRDMQICCLARKHTEKNYTRIFQKAMGSGRHSISNLKSTTINIHQHESNTECTCCCKNLVENVVTLDQTSVIFNNIDELDKSLLSAMTGGRIERRIDNNKKPARITLEEEKDKKVTRKRKYIKKNTQEKKSKDTDEHAKKDYEEWIKERNVAKNLFGLKPPSKSQKTKKNYHFVRIKPKQSQTKPNENNTITCNVSEANDPSLSKIQLDLSFLNSLQPTTTTNQIVSNPPPKDTDNNQNKSILCQLLSENVNLGANIDQSALNVILSAVPNQQVVQSTENNSPLINVTADEMNSIVNNNSQSVNRMQPECIDLTCDFVPNTNSNFETLTKFNNPINLMDVNDLSPMNKQIILDQIMNRKNLETNKMQLVSFPNIVIQPDFINSKSFISIEQSSLPVIFNNDTDSLNKPVLETISNDEPKKCKSETTGNVFNLCSLNFQNLEDNQDKKDMRGECLFSQTLISAKELIDSTDPTQLYVLRIEEKSSSSLIKVINKKLAVTQLNVKCKNESYWTLATPNKPSMRIVREKKRRNVKQGEVNSPDKMLVNDKLYVKLCDDPLVYALVFTVLTSKAEITKCVRNDLRLYDTQTGDLSIVAYLLENGVKESTFVPNSNPNLKKNSKCKSINTKDTLTSAIIEISSSDDESASTAIM